jgi:uncharacterized protein
MARLLILYGVFMRNSTLALSCILLAGVASAQQTTGAPSPKPVTAAASSGSNASPSGPAGLASEAPAHPLTDAQAHEMLEVTGASKIKGQLTQGYMNYIHTSMPFMPKDVSDELQQSFDKLDLETPIIAVYKQHISTDDATAIIAFYKTPAGKDMMETMPTILQQQQQVAVQEGRKTAQDVIQKHRPEIEAAAKQYQEEHAPKPAPSLSTPGSTPAATPGAQPAAPAGTSSKPPQSN